MKKSLISSHSAYHRPRDKLVTYFTKAFKKAEGVTPSQYRRDFLENGT